MILSSSITYKPGPSKGNFNESLLTNPPPSGTLKCWTSTCTSFGFMSVTCTVGRLERADVALLNLAWLPLPLPFGRSQFPPIGIGFQFFRLENESNLE